MTVGDEVSGFGGDPIDAAELVARIEENRQAIILARNAYRAKLDEERARRIEYQASERELLAALERTLDWLPHWGPGSGPEILAQARAAIANAHRQDAPAT